VNLRECAPVDFREVYRIAYASVKDRLLHALKAADILTVLAITVTVVIGVADFQFPNDMPWLAATLSV